MNILIRFLEIIFWLACASGIVCLLAFIIMRVMTKHGYSFEFHCEDDDD